MDGLHIADNLVLLRKERKITQEQLADFIGVTKASVSKWETGQSIPDVMLLPRLATFFDKTIDEILGYEPLLSKEQIVKIYLDLSKDFAEGNFEKTMEKSRKMVKQYYACYPFLNQIILLWLNHWMLADTPEAQQAILQEAAELCQRILDHSKDITLCNDVLVVKATVYLLMGRPAEVIEQLEEVSDWTRLATQSEGVLMEAYQMIGDLEKGKSFTQICMYNHIVSMVGCATKYLALNQDKLDLCEETARRVEPLIQAYELEYLNANVTGLFYYQMALCYGAVGQEKAMDWLYKYAVCIDGLMKEDVVILRTDGYFDKLDSWFEKLELQGKAPRDKKIVWESFRDSIKHPAFLPFADTCKYKKIEKIIKKRGENL